MVNAIINKLFLYLFQKRKRGNYKMCVQLISEIKEKQLPKTVSNVIKIADSILKELDIKSMPVDISKILTGLGFKIYATDILKKNISGFIYISPDLVSKFGTDKIIMINDDDSIGRQRFTLAHEFSHYIFDFDLNTMASYADAYDTNKDDEASEKVSSRFAAEILIPKKFFLNKINELHNKGVNYYDAVSYLTEYFNVSSKSIKMRFKELSYDMSDELKKAYLLIW